jgi:hypothetical protein
MIRFKGNSVRMKQSKHMKPEPPWDLIAKAERALREAVTEVVEAHRQSGEPIIVWQDGRVGRVHPQESMVREKPSRSYRVR